MIKMVYIFWSITGLLVGLGGLFFLPRIFSKRLWISLVFIYILSIYTLYYFTGSSQYLRQYYSKEEVELRIRQSEFRVILNEFKKQEFRYRLRLNNNPLDIDSKWRLHDLLAIKALYQGQKKEALDHWEKALSAIPNQEALKPEKDRMILFKDIILKSFKR